MKMLLYRSLPDGFTLLKGIPSEELKLRDLVFVWKVSDQGLGVQRVASSQGLSNAGKVDFWWCQEMEIGFFDMALCGDM